jgi:hypothetical protein
LPKSMPIERISISMILLFRSCPYDEPAFAGSSSGGPSH